MTAPATRGFVSSLRMRIRTRVWPLAHSVANANTHWTRRRAALVALADDEGNVGLGEASPLPGCSFDGFEETLRALEHVAAHVDRIECALSNASDVMADGARWRRALGQTLDGLGLLRTRLPAARAAIESAVLDLSAQRRRVPLRDVVRAWWALRDRTVALADESAPPNTPRVESGACVETCFALHAETPIDAIDEACAAAVSHGYSTVKLKVGRRDVDATREVAAIQRVRVRHPALRIRCDANGAWPIATVGTLAQALRAAAIEFIEEPVAHAELARMQSNGIPWAADESLVRDADCHWRSNASGAVAVVLKTTVVGGLLRAFELASCADELGVCPVVSHAFEGPVAFALACEFALALGPQRFAAGLAPHAALHAWASASRGHEHRAGRLFARDATIAGLGFDAPARGDLGV